MRKIFVEYGEKNAFGVKVKLLEVSLGKMMNFAMRICGDGSFLGLKCFEAIELYHKVYVFRCVCLFVTIFLC